MPFLSTMDKIIPDFLLNSQCFLRVPVSSWTKNYTHHKPDEFLLDILFGMWYYG